MKKTLIKKVTKCRVCTGNNFQQVLSFGPTPLANSFLTEQQLDQDELYFPLDVYFCHSCTFLQLGHVVSPELFFDNYVYVSSTSPVFINHFKNFAQDIFARFDLHSKSLVVDIGSNDGILLSPFKSLGVRVLGIEPAANIAKAANDAGIKTMNAYFSTGLAKKIASRYGKAKVITATNVFAHIDDLEEVIKGLQTLLQKDGIFIMETPYLIDFIEKNYFDLVYHEHLSYWSVKTLLTLFKRFDMNIFDVQKVDVHGGSIRVFISRNGSKNKKTNRVEKFIKQEEKKKLHQIETYKAYAKRILINKVKLLILLTQLKGKGKTIAGYGAPAKGNTLLNYFGIGTDILDFVIDDSPLKQGLYTPGTHIPVVSSKMLNRDNPDYILILAWNFAQSIMIKYQNFRENGGKFIIPAPIPQIVS